MHRRYDKTSLETRPFILATIKHPSQSLESIALYCRNIFPTCCAVCCDQIKQRETSRYEVERKAVASSVLARQYEFYAGRRVARAALSKLNSGNVFIPKGCGGEPIWPTNYVGSIAHSGSLALAVVAKKSHVLSLGVDLELISAVTEDLWTLIFLPREIEYLYKVDICQRAVIATIMFSAKEAFYKLQYNVTRQYVDFLQTSVQVYYESNCVQIVVNNIMLDDSRLQSIDGRFALSTSHVVTGFTLLSPS